VPINTRSGIERQLDQAASAFLDRTVSVTCRPSPDGGPPTVLLTLPMVLHWFARDFGAGTPADGAAAAMAYLTGQRRELLHSCLEPGLGPRPELSVQYTTFSFACSRMSEWQLPDSP
jgi:hypothetical protein